MTAYLTDTQVEYLLRPIEPHRVGRLDGKSHVEAYEIRAHLTRVFGFGRWSAEVVDLVQLYDVPTQTRGGADAHTVAYRATLRLTVHAQNGDVLAVYTEAAVGGNVMPDSKRADGHDFAVKTAESQALKRCAANLGDQFGLSLYDGGSTERLVGGSLVAGVDTGAREGADVQTRKVAPEDTGHENTAHPLSGHVADVRDDVLNALTVDDLEQVVVRWDLASFRDDGSIAYSKISQSIETANDAGEPCTLWELIAAKGKALRDAREAMQG